MNVIFINIGETFLFSNSHLLQSYKLKVFIHFIHTIDDFHLLLLMWNIFFAACKHCSRFEALYVPFAG